MKKLLVAAVFVLGLQVHAQEIGTEITPVTPQSGAQTPPPDPQPEPVTPPPAQPKPGGYVYRPQGKGGSSSSAPAAPSWTGTKVSAASGDFGVRAGFVASGSLSAPTTTAAMADYSAPTVGIAYFGTDAFKLLVDLGVGFNFASGSWFLGAGAAVGFDYLFRTPGDALRPFFHVAGTFKMAMIDGSEPAIGFGLQLGFGAEYFFSPSFSLNGRMLLAVPMSLPGGDFAIGVYTLTPGVGATWYF